MKNKEKKKYRDIHGTTRVGDFLRSIGKSDVLSKVVDVAGKVVTGNVSGAIKEILSSKELTPEEKDYALKQAELDLKEDVEISQRWETDMTSDSWLSKNTRPLILIYLTLMFTLFVIFDSSNMNFTVRESWVSLLESLLITVFVAYFGSRGFEKVQKIRKK